MVVWQCSKCNFTFDEEEKGEKFESLPESWICPECKTTKDLFQIIKEDVEGDQQPEKEQEEEILEEEELPESELEDTLQIEEEIGPEESMEGEGYSEEDVIEKLIDIKELIEKALGRNE